MTTRPGAPLAGHAGTAAHLAVTGLIVALVAFFVARHEMRGASTLRVAGVASFVALLALLLQVAFAWVFMPALHRGGALGASMLASLHTVARRGPWLILLAAIPLLFIESQLRQWLGFSMDDFAGAALLLVLSAAWLYVACVARAIRLATPAPDEVRRGLRCEGCGYDLTHARERCPECDLRVAESLTAGARRPGWNWERAPDSCAVWLATTWRVLVRPREFYARLEVRGDDRAAQRFRTLHLRWLSAGALAWLAIMLTLVTLANLGAAKDIIVAPRASALLVLAIVALGGFAGIPARPSWLGIALGSPARVMGLLILALLAVPLLMTCLSAWSGSSLPPPLAGAILFGAFGLAAPLVCWAMHRALAALVCTAWFASRTGFDGRVAEKALAYEIVFAWLPCFFWAGLLASQAVFGFWLSGLIGSLFVPGVASLSAEMLVIVGGTTALCSAWCVRMWRALQRVEFANF